MDAIQLSQAIVTNTKDIAQLQAEMKEVQRRIDENDRLTQNIHQLAENVAQLSTEVKMNTERVNTNIEEVKDSLKEQGTRITALEKEPAAKWDKLSWLVISVIATAILSFVIGKFL